MSIRIMSLVFEVSEAEGTDRLVMLALADFCDDEGVCYPGVARVAHKCRISERTAQRSFATLKKLGELVIETGKGAQTATGPTSRYTLTLRRGDKLSPLARGDKSGSEGVTRLSPESSEKHQSIYLAQDEDLLGEKAAEQLSLTITAEPLASTRGKTPAELFPSFTAEQQQAFYTAWTAFVADRAERKRPMTSRAADILLKKLQQQPDRAAGALLICIEKGWTGFDWAWLDKATPHPNIYMTHKGTAQAGSTGGPVKMLSKAQQQQLKKA